MDWNFVIQIVVSLALMAISYALSPRPKLEPPKAAGLDDFALPTAEEGRAIPVVFGTVLLRGPNVVWAGDLSRMISSFSQAGHPALGISSI